MTEADAQPAARTIEKMVRRRSGAQEQAGAFDAAFGRLALRLWQALQRLAGEQARCALRQSSTMSFADYRSGLETASLLAVFELGESAREGLVALTPRLADAAIELLLGGGRVPRPEAPADRRYTPADAAVARRFVRLVIGELAQTLADVEGATGRLGTRLVKTESNPEFVALGPDEGAVAVARFEAVLGPEGDGGMFDVVLPRSTLERVYRPPRQRRWSEPADSDPSQGWRTAMPDAPITLQAVVDRIGMTLLDLARWQVGTLVPLDAAAEQPLTVYCEGRGSQSLGRPIFAGRLGSSRGRRAIRVVEVIHSPHEAGGKPEDVSV